MGTGFFGRLLAAFAMLFALCLAAPAAAATIKPVCHAFSPLSTTYAELASQPDRWICRSTHWKDSQPAGWLRFDARDWQETGPPQTLITRITKFDHLSIFAVKADGTVGALGLTPDDVTSLAGRSIFAAPLPSITDDTVEIVVRVERPWNAAVLSDALLSTEAADEIWPLDKLVLLGVLVGLLFAPLVLDLVLFTVLRQRFVLWHAAMAVAMLGYVVCFTGLVTLFFDVHVVIHAKLNGIMPVLVAAMGGFFAITFLEPYALSRGMRRILLITSGLVLLVPGVITLHPPFLDYRSHQFYFLGYLPAMIVYLLAMAQGARRGSRAAKFLIAAWAPIILLSLERIVRGVGVYGAPAIVDELFYFALAAQIVISAMGVADRLMALRDQRDNARTEARMLENLAEQDPLTGLLNRRAIEPRFSELCADGFTTFALIDLDHFKSVNDIHGHAVGDDVLRVAARGLAPDEDTLVMRLGGEEFLLLLRGKDAGERAEQRRKMLPMRIAEEVPGLSRLVTASMGLVEGTVETMTASGFQDVYSRADKLLYEAKQTGRNRTIGEKLTIFSPRGGDRRATDRRKQARREAA